MASIAAAGAAAAAIGVWYTQRKSPALSDFTEPPKTWGESIGRLHEVVRVSWKEALSKLGIWRLDHLLAIRHLSSRDMSHEIAEEVSSMGVKVEGSHEWLKRLEFIDLAMRYNRLLRGARSIEQIETKLQSMVDSGETRGSSDILLSQLRPAILQPAYILVRDSEKKALFFVIRGTHSVRDTVTSLTAHSKPHHLVDSNGSVVLGRAHAGFLSTARWLAKTIKNDLIDALDSNPGYELTIVGHSLGAGTAVLVTQILRELDGGDSKINKFANTKCLAFACPSALSKELSESCKPFVTTMVTGADIVPTVSFSKVTELQQQIVSAAWEQQVLKKWKQTTRAMAKACTAPRPLKGTLRPLKGLEGLEGGTTGQKDVSKSGAPVNLADPYPGLLTRVPGALLCGFGGRHQRVPLNAEEAVVSERFRVNGVDTGALVTGSATDDALIASAVDRVAHLPGAAARGGGVKIVLRPRRWLGAQMRSLRQNLAGAPVTRGRPVVPIEGNKLTKLASIGTALLASCVTPRHGKRLTEESGGSSSYGQTVTSQMQSDSPHAPPTSARSMDRGDENTFPSSFGRVSPTLAQTASLEAARNAGSTSSASPSTGMDNNLETGYSPEYSPTDAPDDGVLSDDLDLEDLDSSVLLEQLEGEAAQEVLKLQEELAVIQAADGEGGFGVGGVGDVGDDEDDMGDFKTRQDGLDTSVLPEPTATTSDPVALLGPGAPEEILEAARSGMERDRDELNPQNLSEPTGETVDASLLKSRIETGKGGSNWNANSAKNKSSEVKEDPDAFKVKLYPAGEILHMVLVDEKVLEEVTEVNNSSQGQPQRHYELYADVDVEAYDRIRLSKTMLSDHFLPKYLEALTEVRARLTGLG